MRAAVLLFAFLASVAVQSNATCDLKGPIDKMAEKVCSFKGEVPGKAICLDCVKKIFKNEGTCKFDEVEFPGELDVCSASVKDKDFADIIYRMEIHKHLDKLEQMVEQVPKLKKKFCSMGAVDDGSSAQAMEVLQQSGITEGAAKVAQHPIMVDVTNTMEKVGERMCEKSGKYCHGQICKLIDKHCKNSSVCDKMKKCVEQLIAYAQKMLKRRRRKRWLESMNPNEVLD